MSIDNGKLLTYFPALYLQKQNYNSYKACMQTGIKINVISPDIDALYERHVAFLGIAKISFAPMLTFLMLGQVVAFQASPFHSFPKQFLSYYSIQKKIRVVGDC